MTPLTLFRIAAIVVLLAGPAHMMGFGATRPEGLERLAGVMDVNNVNIGLSLVIGVMCLFAGALDIVISIWAGKSAGMLRTAIILNAGFLGILAGVGLRYLPVVTSIMFGAAFLCCVAALVDRGRAAT